jgi:uncharacterized protein (DUF2062 family)
MERTIAARLETRPVALAIGVASVVQGLCFALVIAVVGAAYASGDVTDVALGVRWLVALTLAGTLLCTLAQAALIWHANETDALDGDERRRWLIRLTIWGPVVMPAYWLRYVRR